MALAGSAAQALADQGLTYGQFGGIVLSDNGEAAHCTDTVMVCGRKLNPLGVEIGGSFTVRINQGYHSTYRCTIVDGRATWIPASTAGSCEETPVIMLPDRYGDGWHIG